MNKLLHSTKAQQQDPGDGGWSFTGTSKIFFWVGMILLMVIVFVIYVQITGNYISSLVAPPSQLSADLMAQRATGMCFSSPQQTANAAIISKDLFTSQQLFDCVGDKENLRVRLRLRSIDGAFTNEVIQTRTGGFSSFSTHFVLVNHTTQGRSLLSPALLEVEVQ